MRAISKVFHSNCLFEAIKAKLKDWSNVKIIKVGKDIMLNSSHFMWVNKATNKVYDFSYAGGHKPFTTIWFKGEVREQDLTSFNLFLYNRMTSAGNNLEGKLALKYDLFNISGLVGVRYIEDKDYPELEEAKLVRAWHSMVQVNRLVNGNLIIEFVDISENSIPEDTYTWQYVTKFNPNYDMVLKSQGQL